MFSRTERNSGLSGPSAWATSSVPRRCAQARDGRRPASSAPMYASPMSSSVLRSRNSQSHRAYEAVSARTFFTSTVAPRAIGLVTATESAGSLS
jgi:hypothetical protein